jgi:class 3 adenylate cyclase
MWIDKINLWASVRKYFTVLFLDIIWFTTLTENISHDKALEVLNTYFDWIVDIIKSYWWYVDKFLWDWILIIFDNNVSDDAINASIKIQEFVLKNPIIDIWKNISVWIWINSWEVILWTIGSKNRMEITIIWDVVNTASRIEWLTRELNEKIIISDRTYSNIINKNQFFINELWYKSLKWKKTKIKIYWIASKLNKKI